MNFLDFYSGSSLINRNDLGIMLELAAGASDPELWNNIVFTGKSFWNIALRLSKAKPGELGLMPMENELASLEEKIYGYLELLVQNAYEQTRAEFHNKYFEN